MKPKFFSQISDHQQSVAPAPSRGLPIPPALLVVADFMLRILFIKEDDPPVRFFSANKN
jgi:hypothetical protein